MARFVVASDIHGLLNQYDRIMQTAVIHDADAILLAGDLIEKHLDLEVYRQYFKKIAEICPIYMTPGNNDHWSLDTFDDIPRCTVLVDKAATIKGIKCYFTPWILNVVRATHRALPQNTSTWVKFTKPFQETEEVSIPKGTRVVITHGPPYGIMDLVDGRHSGSIKLLNAVLASPTVTHVFQGHIHNKSMGRRVVDNKIFQNVSILDDFYSVKDEKIIVVDIHKEQIC